RPGSAEDGVRAPRGPGDLQGLPHPDLVGVRDAVRLGDPHVAGAAGAAVVLERDVRQRVPGLDRVDDVAALVGDVELRGVLDDLQASVVDLGDARHAGHDLPDEVQLGLGAD